MPARDVDDTILRHLATHPFLSAADLEVRWGVATATMARTLARLRDAGLVERVPQGDDKTFLYVPTGDGAIAAAASTSVALGSLCRIYGLDRRQLLTRLPLLKRLVYAQRFVMELAAALDDSGEGRLTFYKSGPLHWHAARARSGPRGEVLLDGMGRIDVDGGVSYWFGLLWDGDGTLPSVGLWHQFDRLHALRRDEATALPPVLVVTAAADRLAAAGTPPPSGVIYTTVADYVERGALDARWVGRRRGGGTIEDALLALLAAVPAARSNPWDLTHWPPGTVHAGDALGLERRVARLRRGLIEGRPTPTGLLALALPRGVVGLLDTIGSFPLLDARGLAVLTRRNASVLRDELGWLRGLDLIRVYRRGLDAGGKSRFWAEEGDGEGPPRPPRPPRVVGAERPVMVYALTYRGTRLLAARVGVSPATYRILYKKLDASPIGGRAGLVFALGNAAHTLAIQEVFFAVLAAVDRREATLRWLWEWGCVERLDDGDAEGDGGEGEDKWEGEEDDWGEAWDEDEEDRAARLRRDVLRPDARIMVDVGGVGVDVFLEVDRSTETHAEIAAKLALYHRYARLRRRRAVEAAGGDNVALPPITVAFVTTRSEERAVNVVQTAKNIARELESRAVRVVAAHLDTVERWDMLGEIWIRDAYPDRPGPLSPRRCFLVPDLVRLTR